MISIYSKNNTDFEHNGDAVLIPTSCKLSATINGAWQLTLEHPYDPEERYKYIVEGATIVADIRFIRELSTTRQKFRIYNYVKGLHSVTAIAFPVAMESTYDAPIDNLVISGKTGAQAMAQLQTKTNKYTLSSDITRTGSTSFSNTNINSAIASGDEGCFIDVWGGDILYDNLTFSVKNRLGDNVAADHPVIYGRNLTDIEYKKDDSGLTTRIYPISQDGIRLNGTGYVDSSRISDYPVPHSKFMTAPYSLIDTNAGSSTSTATKTQQAVSGVSTEASTTSQSVYATLKGNGYQPEYIKSIRNAIVEAVQTMALASVVSTSYYNLMANTIKSAMDWMGSLSQPKWEWMGSDQTGWKYGNASSYAKNMFVKIGKTWSYFGSDGNWQEPKDDSDEWDWHDAKGGTGKKYGNFTKYYAHNEYVYITVNGTIKEYWFNEQGWFEEDESGDSDYYWHGSGTGADPYWFGSSSSDYLKSCWRFIDGTYYFFDSYGYVATQKDNYQWDWNDNGDSSRAWFGNAINSEYGSDGACLKSQWQKINGTWYYFDSNGLVVDEAVSQTQTVAAFTTGMVSVKTTVDSWASQLYTLLYSLMTSYANKQFASGVDLPTITITVKMADLKKTTEYADYAHLEEIKLGDSVKCIDAVHDITTENRIIGITYDILRDYNESIVIGSASATVAQMVGNAGGEAAAQGFDTSALETQLAALRNGKQDKLTAGDNITIENNVISATGGSGSNIYYDTDEPSASLGTDKDYYCQLSDDPQTIIGTPVAYGSMDTPSITAQSFNEFSAVIGGIPTAYAYPREDEVEIPLENLIEGNTYTFSFDYQFDSGTRFFNTHNDGLSINGERILFEEDTQVHSYSITFTAQETNILVFGYHTVYDDVHFTSHLTNGRVTGVFKSIINVWVKVGNLWIKDAFGSALRAGDNIQISNGVISATNTDSIAEQTDVELDNLSNGQVLKYNLTTQKWENGDESGGSEVEANPSDPATDTLNTIGIDGTVYNIAGGGGGGNALIVDAQIYSEDEQVVGVWTDGKPLYEKTYVWNETISGTSTNKTISLDHPDYVFIESGHAINSAGAYIPLPYAHSNTSNDTGIFVGTDKTYVGFRVGSNTVLTKAVVTIRYTKTTDVAGSGGYQAYGFTPVIYSTEEREIGVWTDNKPLYQKTFRFNSLTSVSQNIWFDTGFTLNDCTIVGDATAFRDDNVAGQSFPIVASCDLGTNQPIDILHTRNTSIEINGFTIQYTKTTDVAGSGSYNTLGVPTVHYTTDEQVIGTWIDGKPLYERSYSFTNTRSSFTDYVTLYNIPNIETVVKNTFTALRDLGQNEKLHYTGESTARPEHDTSYYINVREYNGNIQYRINGYGTQITEMVITTQYTKTTD